MKNSPTIRVNVFCLALSVGAVSSVISGSAPTGLTHAYVGTQPRVVRLLFWELWIENWCVCGLWIKIGAYVDCELKMVRMCRCTLTEGAFAFSRRQLLTWCVSVSVCVSVCVCVSGSVRMHVHLCMCACIRTFVHVCMCACVHVCMYTYACACVHVHVHVHVCVCVHIPVHVCVCVYVCMYVYACVSVYTAGGNGF